jgi:hypothetical protein
MPRLNNNGCISSNEQQKSVFFQFPATTNEENQNADRHLYFRCWTSKCVLLMVNVGETTQKITVSRLALTL